MNWLDLETSEVNRRWQEGLRGMRSLPDLSKTTQKPAIVLRQWVDEAKSIASANPRFAQEHGIDIKIIEMALEKAMAESANLDEMHQMAAAAINYYRSTMNRVEADAKAIESGTYRPSYALTQTGYATVPTPKAPPPPEPVTAADFTQPTGSNVPVWFESLSEALEAVQRGVQNVSKIQQQEIAQQLMTRQDQGKTNYLPQSMVSSVSGWSTGTKILVGLGLGILGIGLLVALTGRGTTSSGGQRALPAPSRKALPAP